jgi:probable rRNA maturation factor
VTLLEADVVKAVRVPVPAAFIKGVLAHAGEVPEIAARLPSPNAKVALRLTSDRELERLNRAYAGEDHATDVLSFAGSGDHLGDIAISWPAVERQAGEYGHDARTELALLSVHGLLHLLGWDHATAAGRREMTRLTVAALNRSDLGLAPRRL